VANPDPVNCPSPGDNITSIAVDPGNSSIVYVTVNGFEGAQQYHVFRSANGGSTWSDISTSLPDQPFQSVIVDPSNHTTIYASANVGVYVSKDSGATWSVVGTGLPDVVVYDLTLSADGSQLTAFTHGRGAWRIYPNGPVRSSRLTPTPVGPPTNTPTPVVNRASRITPTSTPSGNPTNTPTPVAGRTPHP
jgi:hypothetical protein